MVELMGVEPTTSTLRTSRSSQMSYSPMILFSYFTPFPENVKHLSIFFPKKTGFGPPAEQIRLIFPLPACMV